ncbi:hypothetical protein ACOME3_003359 [Neoechinorhynchus agilis]
MREPQSIRIGEEFQSQILDYNESHFAEDDDSELVELENGYCAHDRASQPCAFSVDEANAFTKGYAIYGTSFHKIQVEFLPLRKIGDIIWFYHVWIIDPRTEAKMAPIKMSNLRQGKRNPDEMDVVITEHDEEQTRKEVSEGRIPLGLHSIRDAWLATDQMKAVRLKLVERMDRFKDEFEE